MCVLGEVTTSAALLGTVALRNAKDIPQCWYHRFEVQLRALCEVRWLSIIIQPKESGPTFTLGLYKGRGSDLKVALGEVVLTERLRCSGP